MEEDRIRLKKEFIQENPHISLLEQLSKEDGEESALQFMDISNRRNTAIQKARKIAFEEKTILFQKISDTELPSDKIDTSKGIYFVKKAFKGSLRKLREVYLNNPKRSSPEAEKYLKNRILDFEELKDLDTRAIIQVLGEVDTSQLVHALKTSNEDVRDCFLQCMSTRSAALLMESMGF